MMNPRPDFAYEKKLWFNGVTHVIGIDEVGRGALAGPIVVGAVLFPKHFVPNTENAALESVQDSKQLDRISREQLAPVIKRHCLRWAIGASSAQIVDRIGIVQALEQAAHQALNYLALTDFHVLTDLNLLKSNLFNPQVTEVKDGDKECFSIAAASIIAKVWRDQYMERLGRQWNLKVYRWKENSGYGTKHHRTILRTYGPSSHHRFSYLRSII